MKSIVGLSNGLRRSRAKAGRGFVECLESRRLFAAGAAPAPALTLTLPIGTGVVGDGATREYQINRNPNNTVDDRNSALGFVEQIIKKFKASSPAPFNFGTLTNKNSNFNNNGYSFNRSNDQATTDFALAASTSNSVPGEVQAVESQVRAGQVTLVFVSVGAQDFITAAEHLNPSSVARAASHAIANLRTIISRLEGASPNSRIVISTVPDAATVPGLKTAFDTAAGRKTFRALRAAERRYNAFIRGVGAADGRAAVADVRPVYARATFGIGRATVLHRAGDDAAGKIRADQDTKGKPRHLYLSDGIHLGNVGEALVANVFIDAVNHKFNTRIPELSRSDILNAGPPAA